MGVKDWWKQRGAKRAEEEARDRYKRKPTEELLKEAEAINWKPTRTVPGILLDDLSPKEKALLTELDGRDKVQFVIDSKSLGGGQAFYAKNNPLLSVIEAMPDYQAARGSLLEAREEKSKANIEVVAALPGWKSDYRGGYQITVSDEAAGGRLVSTRHEDILRVLEGGRMGALHDDHPNTIYTTKNPDLIAAIERHLPPQERRSTTDEGPEPQRER